jgi:DNA repair exonuclease SbcCD ATPase subunit
MWLLFVFAWVCFLALVAVVARQGFGYDLGRLSAQFFELPQGQRWAAGFIVVMAIALIGTSIFLSLRMSRQGESLRLLRARLKSARDDMVVAHGLQSHFDGVVQHLVDSTPQEAIAALQTRLTETEQKVALQHSQNEATDIEQQLDDIRHRQQALRETVGEVAEKRRLAEPVFAEIKDRQRQLERSLSKLEVDDDKQNLTDRLQETSMEVLAIQKRLTVLQESLVTLNRFKQDLDKTSAELGPLQAQGADR